jgi:hypothetical protein
MHRRRKVESSGFLRRLAHVFGGCHPVRRFTSTPLSDSSAISCSSRACSGSFSARASLRYRTARPLVMGIQGRGGRFGVQATQGAPKPLGAKPITHWRGHARREMAKQKDPPKAVCLSVESGPQASPSAVALLGCPRAFGSSKRRLLERPRPSKIRLLQ